GHVLTVTARLVSSLASSDSTPLTLTVGAVSDDVQGVRRREEPLLGGQLIDHAGHGSFERGGGRHVDHLAAARTQQVMVVMQEVLGHLETSELVARRDATY